MKARKLYIGADFGKTKRNSWYLEKNDGVRFFVFAVLFVFPRERVSLTRFTSVLECLESSNKQLVAGNHVVPRTQKLIKKHLVGSRTTGKGDSELVR